MVSPFKFWSLFGFCCFPFRGFGLTLLNRWKGAGRGSALLMSVFFLRGRWPRLSSSSCFYSRNGDGSQDSWLRSTLIMSIVPFLLPFCSRVAGRVIMSFLGPQTRTTVACWQILISPSPLAPPHLPPREKTQG